jgi:tetratricopeptide (TPR) repeat protein
MAVLDSLRRRIEILLAGLIIIVERKMIDHGYVYVLMNPSMENLVKIGKTKREPAERAKELSATRGMPTPFVVVYHSYFENCSDAEAFIHTYLEHDGHRTSSNREFFEISIKDAIDALLKAKEHFGELAPKSGNNHLDEDGIFTADLEDLFLDDLNYEEEIVEPWDEVFELAETYHLGLDDEIVDYEEAMKYYLQAIKLGAVKAYERVGAMYAAGEGVKADGSKALKYFKEGCKKGESDCYARMASLFAGQGHVENAEKCWQKYFTISREPTAEFGFSYLAFLDVTNCNEDFLHKLTSVKAEIYQFTESLKQYSENEGDFEMGIINRIHDRLDSLL